MKLSVITYILHKENGNNFYSYGPYVREMNLWFKTPDFISITAPKITNGTPGPAEVPYEGKNINFREVPEISFTNFIEGTSSLSKLPKIVNRLYETMKEADHIHLRCPGNISLIACFLQILFPSKPKTVKYAGNWDPKAKQPWTYRLQKWLLRNPFLTRNMAVLVYGDWPKQSKNIIPFFTASFSENLKSGVKAKKFNAPFLLLFVGNLVEGKRPLLVLKLVKELLGRGANVRLEIYGEGPERTTLQSYCRENHLEEHIQFKGSRPLGELQKAYAAAHFVVLPSKSEGWPKAVAEGMFFGCIPIATTVSCIPWMLGNGSRGLLLQNAYLNQSSRTGARMEETEIVKQHADRISDLLKNPKRMERISEAAKKWSQQYTLERFEKAVQKLLENGQYEGFKR